MDALNTQQKNEKSQMKILTDLSLWKMFAQGAKKTQKLNRFEAFFDLLNRQRIALLAEDEGNINFSALELSKAWGWDRVTVTKFIDNLQKLKLKVLTVSTSPKRKLIKLERVTLIKEPPGASPFRVDAQTTPQASNTPENHFTASERPKACPTAHVNLNPGKSRAVPAPKPSQSIGTPTKALAHIAKPAMVVA